MDVKSIHPINFLYFRVETRVSELSRFLPVAQDLFREAAQQNIPVTGPVHWHYYGFTGDVNKPFQLEVAIPVGEIPDEYDGRFHFKRTESFKCVIVRHEGNWLDLPATYDKAMEFMKQNKLTPSAVNREVYINADFRYPESNITEVQIGIN